MGKPHTKFEPIQLKAGSGWYVRITLPHGAQSHINYFKQNPSERGSTIVGRTETGQLIETLDF